MMQKISVKCTEKGGNNCWRCDVLQPDLGCGWCEGSKVCTAVSQCAVGPWRKSHGYISHSSNAKKGDFNTSFSCHNVEYNETTQIEDDSNLSLAAVLFIAIAILVVIVVIVVLVYFISIIGTDLRRKKRNSGFNKRKRCVKENEYKFPCIRNNPYHSESITPKRKYDSEIQAYYDTSLNSTNIRHVQRQMFGRHNKTSSSIGCVNCIGRGLEIANGESQIHNNSVRLLAYNKRKLEDDIISKRLSNHRRSRISSHYVPYPMKQDACSVRSRPYSNRSSRRMRKYRQNTNSYYDCNGDIYRKPRIHRKTKTNSHVLHNRAPKDLDDPTYAEIDKHVSTPTSSFFGTMILQKETGTKCSHTWSSGVGNRKSINRHRAYSCNINRLSLIWNRLSAEIQTTSSSTSHHECENGFGNCGVPEELDDNNDIYSKSTTSANCRDFKGPLDIYGGSIIGNFTNQTGNNGLATGKDAAANCQTSLIQTSQNQCYIVVQLNLPNSTEISVDENDVSNNQPLPTYAEKKCEIHPVINTSTKFGTGNHDPSATYYNINLLNGFEDVKENNDACKHCKNCTNDDRSKDN